MEDIKQEDLVEETVTPAVEETNLADPLQIELEKIQKKSGKTEAEKAKDNLYFNAKRAKELGLDPAEILGFKSNDIADEEDEDKPLTIGMWNKMQKENASQTALNLAENITSPVEKELVKYHLENSIKSTGNPTEDLKLARAIVNSTKNAQVIEEMTRKTQPSQRVSSGGGTPASEPQVEFTKDELVLMKMAGLSKEEVLKSRP